MAHYNLNVDEYQHLMAQLTSASLSGLNLSSGTDEGQRQALAEAAVDIARRAADLVQEEVVRYRQEQAGQRSKSRFVEA